MPDRIVTGQEAVTGQELVAHVFALREGPGATASIRAVLAMWARCRDTLGTSEPVAGLRTDLRAERLTPVRGRSMPVAGMQRPDGLVQAIARCDDEVLGFSVLLKEGLAPTWHDLRDQLSTVLGDDAAGLLGVCILHLGKCRMADSGPAADIARAVAGLIPSPDHPDGWWHEGVRTSTGLGVWELTTDDSASQREFLVLAEPTPAGDMALTVWSWTLSGGAEIPPFAGYLLHLGKIRYQLWVMSAFPAAAELQRLTVAGRGTAQDIEGTANRLHTMRLTVETSWQNAVQALSAGGWTPDFDRADLFGRDHDLVTWFTDQLSLDIKLWTGHGQDRTGGRRAIGPPPTINGRPLRVLAIADEWLPAHGGISQLNRSLCAALVSLGAKVTCLVPAATAAEYADAAGLRVRLQVSNILHAQLSGAAPTGQSPIPATDLPDVVFGHSRFTGGIARDLVTRHCPDAVRVHFIHMVADHLAAGKPGRDPSRIAEERGDEEIDLGSDAPVVVSVGPGLQEWSEREMPSEKDGGPVRYQLDPGFDHPLGGDRAVPKGRPKIMIMGRTQDAWNKGIDLACRAVGKAAWLTCHRSQWDLLTRGVPLAESEDFARQLKEWTADAPSVNLIPPRYFTTDSEAVRRDLRTSSLLPLASRAEGYGLVGQEALVAGTPLLASDRSGLGMLLAKVLPPELRNLVVVPVKCDDKEDIDRWGHYIAGVLENRRAAFATAAEVRRVMAQERTWEMAALGLLEKVRPLLSSPLRR